MKKAIILILGGAASLTLSLVLGINAQSRTESLNGLFEANVEALADIEHWGKCENKSNLCQTVCPECGEDVWVQGYLGPGQLTHCSCSGTMTPIKDTDGSTRPSN